VGEGIAGWVARHGQLLIVPNVEGDARFSSRLDEITQVKTRSVICVPLRSKHRVLGVIQLVNANVEMSEQEIFFLQALCDYAAISIENARAVEKIQELTITDDCTGLFNARHLHKTLEPRCIVHALRLPIQRALYRLDHFKTVNDTHGHLVEAGCWPRSLSDQGAVAADRFCISLWRRRVCRAVAPDQQGSAVVVARRITRFAALGCLLHRTGLEPERARQHGAGHVSA